MPGNRDVFLVIESYSDWIDPWSDAECESRDPPRANKRDSPGDSYRDSARRADNLHDEPAAIWLKKTTAELADGTIFFKRHPLTVFRILISVHHRRRYRYKNSRWADSSFAIITAAFCLSTLLYNGR